MMHMALVVVEESQADTVLPRVNQLVQVTQRLPPRLAIVQGEKGQLEAVSKLPGVVSVSEGSVPDSVLKGLNPTERIFADAWVLSRKPKVRPGEGLPWDAEGFQPPDKPDGGSTK
jgi:hypothetical protein